MIPLVHDLSAGTVIVVGGGQVGARKARYFAQEARTLVYSPEFCDESFGDAECVRLALSSDELEHWLGDPDPSVVVAATDDHALNEAIEDVAREQGALVNRADTAGERGPGSIIVPATVSDPPVQVAVTTSGQSPALSRYLREEIEDTIQGAGTMATLSSELRTDLKERDVPESKRRAAIRAVVRSEEVWKNLRGGTSNPRRVATDVVAEVLENE